MQADELVFYVKLSVKPDRVEAWLEALHAIVGEMSKEEAFIACHLHRDAQDPCLFTLYERWAEPDVESFVRNQMKPYRLAYDAKLEDLLQRPREAQVLVPLGHWARSGG